jgi:hypothetical protein
LICFFFFYCRYKRIWRNHVWGHLLLNFVLTNEIVTAVWLYGILEVTTVLLANGKCANVPNKSEREISYVLVAVHILCSFSLVQSKNGVRGKKFCDRKFELIKSWYMIGCENIKKNCMTYRRWCHEHYDHACRCVHFVLSLAR